jgi:hypothetical protein
MLRQIRVVLPPWWALLGFAALYGGTHAFDLWMASIAPDDPTLRRMSAILLMAGSAAHGLFRGVRYHPFFQQGYCAWLDLTPWTSAKPLLLGPVQLVPADTVVLAAVAVLGGWRNPEIGPFGPPLAMLIGYWIALGATFWSTGQSRFGCALVFLFGLMLRLSPWPMAAAAVALMVVFPLAWVGVHRSLAAFPWRGEAWFRSKVIERMVNPSKFGWPWNRLAPDRPPMGVSYRTGTTVGLLVGWLVYSYVSLELGEPEKIEEGLRMAQFGTITVAVVVRLGIYCWARLPPISLWGRWGTGRWIVPGYDQVFVAPLLAAAAGLAVPEALALLGVPLTIGVPVAVCLVLVVSFNLGPSLQEWQLTGAQRIVAALSGSQDYVRL